MQTAKYKRGEKAAYIGHNPDLKGQIVTVFSIRWDFRMKTFYYSVITENVHRTAGTVRESNLVPYIQATKEEYMPKFKLGDPVRYTGKHLYGLIGLNLTVASCVTVHGGRQPPMYGLNLPNGRRWTGLVAEHLLMPIKPYVPESFVKGEKVTSSEAEGTFEVLCVIGEHASVFGPLESDHPIQYILHTKSLKHVSTITDSVIAETRQKFPIDAGVYVGDDKETMWVIKEFLPETREYRMTMFTHKASAHDGFARECDLVLAVERCPMQYAVGDIIVPVTLPTQFMKVIRQNLWTVQAETLSGHIGTSYSTCQIRHATRQELDKMRSASCGEASGRDVSQDDVWEAFRQIETALRHVPTDNFQVAFKAIRELHHINNRHN